jgi:hypothetical protein
MLVVFARGCDELVEELCPPISCCVPLVVAIGFRVVFAWCFVVNWMYFLGAGKRCC